MARTKPRRASGGVRVALLEAARREFEERGFAGATTRRIAERADTSEVMLFRHFRSKENLFKEVVFDPFDRYITEFIEREFNENTPTVFSHAAWKRFSAGLYDLLNDNRDLFIALIVAFNYDHGANMNVNDLTSLEGYFIHCEQAWMRSTSEADRKALPDVKILVRLIFGFLASVALFKDWLFPPDLADEEVVKRAMQRFVEQAIGIPTDG